MKIDKKIIKELSDYLDEFNLTELEYTEKDTKIKVSKNKISLSNQPSSIENKPHQHNLTGTEKAYYPNKDKDAIEKKYKSWKN